MSDTTKAEAVEFILTAQEIKTATSVFGNRVSAEEKCAELFATLHARCVEVLDCSDVKAVQVVKAELSRVLAPHYAEDYVEKVVRVVAADFRAVSGMEPARKKGAGRKADAPSYNAAQGAIAAYERIAGFGVLPSKKTLSACAKFLVALATEKTTLAEIKAVRVSAPVRTGAEIEAGKGVKIPAQPVHATK